MREDRGGCGQRQENATLRARPGAGALEEGGCPGRLDRLGRSLKHLIELMAELERAGIGFQSLQEHIDTTSPGVKLVFHIFGALAEFERNLIQERTKAGLEAARARGRKGGRPKSLTAQQRALALDLYTQRKHTVEEICRSLGISKPTLYAYVCGESSSSKP